MTGALGELRISANVALGIGTLVVLLGGGIALIFGGVLVVAGMVVHGVVSLLEFRSRGHRA